ncbi:MAG: adenosine deaminase, partial [Bdellovibrionales bacterium]|nr:adenosine deaminase [Bdellovibrionales bacterium]
KDTFIGADLADSEADFNPADFKEIFDKIYDKNLPITIHSGETPDARAAQRIKDSIDILHAQRIGHGIQLVTDTQILEYVKNKNVLLEICPISNVLTKAFTNRSEHPFKELYLKNVLVSINSDDPGIFNTNLCDDYSYLIQKYQLSIDDISKINEMAMRSSFINATEKEKYWPY